MVAAPLGGARRRATVVLRDRSREGPREDDGDDRDLRDEEQTERLHGVHRCSSHATVRFGGLN
jgi:hypothetical protein